jgi:transcriptional regulator with XRE-family HTH domain
VPLKRLRFVQRRKALGLTQEELAERLQVERSTIVRWEAGDTEPQPWQRPRIAEALKITLAELNGLLDSVTEVPGRVDGYTLVSSVPLDFSLTQAHTVQVMEGFSGHDLASRRHVLAELALFSGAALLRPVRAWAAAVPTAPLGPRGVGSEELGELERAVRVFRRWDASGAGGLRRKAVVGQLNAVTETLGEPRPTDVRQRLFGIAAELAQLSGWMAYDQGLYGLAQRYYVLALHACREGGLPELGAKVIGDMTQMSTALGNYEDSLNLVHTALYSLPRSSSALVRSELLGLEARAYAQLGSRETDNSVRAANACVEVYGEERAEPAADWIHYMKRAEVDCLAANTYIELALRAEDPGKAQRYAAEAERYTVSAIDSRDGLYTRSRIFDEIRLAKVRLAQDEPQESATVGQRCVGLAERTRSALVVEWLIRFDAELEARHPTHPDVRQFQDRLRDYARKASPQRELQRWHDR